MNTIATSTNFLTANLKNRPITYLMIAKRLST